MKISQKRQLFLILNSEFLIIFVLLTLFFDFSSLVFSQEDPAYLTVVVDENGEFSVNVALEENQTNNIVMIPENDGVFGEPVIVTVQQVKSGEQELFTIETPKEGISYTNPSVTVMGEILNTDKIKEIRVENTKAPLIGNYYARQVIFDTPGEHTVTVTAVLKDETTVSKTIPVIYAQVPEGEDNLPPEITVLFPQNGAILNQPFLEIMGTLEEGSSIKNVNANGVVPHAMVGNIFLVYAELSKQGENTIVIEATDEYNNKGLHSLSLVLDSTIPPTPVVDPVPYLIDTPAITISGHIDNWESINSPSPLIGEGLVGGDDFSPLPSEGEGQGEGENYSGLKIIISGGLVTTTVRVNETGTFSTLVPVKTNKENILEIISTGRNQVSSEPVIVKFAHDDKAPELISSSPFDGEASVAIDDVITFKFSEPMDKSTINSESVLITNRDQDPIPGNLSFSPDGSVATFIPLAKLQREDLIEIVLKNTITDQHGLPLTSDIRFAFETASYQTTISGVILNPDLKPIEGVKLFISAQGMGGINSPSPLMGEGWVGGEYSPKFTSSFGTFLLDAVHEGEQYLVIDGTSVEEASYGVLIYKMEVVKGQDNSLGRPIFLVPTNIASSQIFPSPSLNSPLPSEGEGQGGGENNLQTLNFNNTIPGFSITVSNGSVLFPNGTGSGSITATQILPEHIPARLPDGSIPHFLVRLETTQKNFPLPSEGEGQGEGENNSEFKIQNLFFSPPTSLTFPNVYNLQPGEKVKVFHFSNGIHTYAIIGEGLVNDGNIITTGPILSESGYIGIIPENPEADLTRGYLKGNVVDSAGNGIPNIKVNAMASSTIVLTNENGEYLIPLPDLRLEQISVYASVPTNFKSSNSPLSLSMGEGQVILNSPSPLMGEGRVGGELIFHSSPVNLNPSGVTTVPDIIINTFNLVGNIRFFNRSSTKIVRSGSIQFNLNQEVVSVSEEQVRGVKIYVYKKIKETGLDCYSTQPVYQSIANQDAIDPVGWDCSFILPITGNISSTGEDQVGGDEFSPLPSAGEGQGEGGELSPSPLMGEGRAGGEINSKLFLSPGDQIKIIAFDEMTGFYAEAEKTIPSLAQNGDNGLDVYQNLTLYPPDIRLDIKRCFYLDGVLIKSQVLNKGLILSSDQYAEVSTIWISNGIEPINRPEVVLHGRLDVDMETSNHSYFYTIPGGKTLRVIELRGIYPERLQVLEQESEVGKEFISICRDRSFRDSWILPVTIEGESESSSKVELSIVEFNAETGIDGSTAISGRTKPGETVIIRHPESGEILLSVQADENGYFKSSVVNLGDLGLRLSVGDSKSALFGASLKPILESITPLIGPQGDTVTLTGKYFSEIPQLNKVHFNGTPADVTSVVCSPLVQEGQGEGEYVNLQVLIPPNATSGLVTVTVGDKTSNGVHFDVISNGLPNPGFETGDFKGYSRTGSAVITTKYQNISPSEGIAMAYLNTQFDPKDGITRLTTDRFYPGGNYLAFDYQFLGTLVFNEPSDLLQISIIQSPLPSEGEGQGEGVEIVLSSIFPTPLTTFTGSIISGYSDCSGMRTAYIDLTSYNQEGADPIQVCFQLKGRGPLPDPIPGLRPDDDNPLDVNRVKGTGLLLDNLRIAGTTEFPGIIDETKITVTPPVNGFSTITGTDGTVPGGFTIFATGIQTGDSFFATADANGAFSLEVEAYDSMDTYYVLNIKSLNGVYGEPIELRINN